MKDRHTGTRPGKREKEVKKIFRPVITVVVLRHLHFEPTVHVVSEPDVRLETRRQKEVEGNR